MGSYTGELFLRGYKNEKSPFFLQFDLYFSDFDAHGFFNLGTHTLVNVMSEFLSSWACTVGRGLFSSVYGAYFLLQT